MVTLPRSGATLFAQHLGLHSEIFHMGESMYWELLGVDSIRCSCGMKKCPYLVSIYDVIAKKHIAEPLLRTWQIIDQKYWSEKKSVDGSLFLNESRENIGENSLKYWISRCPKALNKIVDTYGKKFNKSIFLDNTKLSIVGEKMIESSDWGIMVLLRDPRGVMNSYKNAGIRKCDSRNLASLVPFCADFIKTVCRLAKRKNVTVLRYEDFCMNPEFTLRKVCSFIGIQFQKRMLGSIHFPICARGHVIKGNRLLMRHADRHIELDEEWKNNLSGKELKLLTGDKTITRLYGTFGYNLT